MTGTVQLQRVALTVAVIGLLVGAPAEAGRTAGAEQVRFQSSVAISPTGVLASRAGDAVDTRLVRDTKAEKSQRSVRQDGLTGSASPGQRAQAWATALAAVLEHAGHPERVGHILLRGPPASSD